MANNADRKDKIVISQLSADSKLLSLETSMRLYLPDYLSLIFFIPAPP